VTRKDKETRNHRERERECTLELKGWQAGSRTFRPMVTPAAWFCHKTFPSFSPVHYLFCSRELENNCVEYSQEP
jgi:hypothetical protein